MFSPKIVLMGKSAEHIVLGGQEHKCKGHGLYEADGVTLVPTSSLFSTSQHLCWEANCKCSQVWEVPGPLHSGPLSSMSLLTHVEAVLWSPTQVINEVHAEPQPPTPLYYDQLWYLFNLLSGPQLFPDKLRNQYQGHQPSPLGFCYSFYEPINPLFD